MNFEDLDYFVDDGVARILFDRPGRKNALGNETTQNLMQLMQYADSDDSVRVIVLSGNGDAFCAGGDFKDTFQKGQGRTQQQWEQRIKDGPNKFVNTVRNLSKPVIAAINGVAVGGGVTIALACDIRIAADNARFSLPFAKIGLTPEFGCSYLLPRIVGMGNALNMLMMADFIDAEEALRIGLVNAVVPQAQFKDSVAEIANRIKQNSKSSLNSIKQLINVSLSSDINQVLELEAQHLGRAFNSEDHKAAVQSFLNRKSN